MSDNLAVTMMAGRRQGMNRALEAVEGMGLASRGNNLESLIVLVAANTTLRHLGSPPQHLYQV
jgi:hypothetical protein